MNFAHLHLLLNHFPVVGIVLAVGLLGFGLIKKQSSVVDAAKGTIVLVALGTLPTFFSGEPAEKQIKGMAEFSENLVHAHEEAALLALIVTLAAGALALLLLIRFRTKAGLHLALVAIGVIAIGLMARAGNLGGQIQHAEIRDSQSSPAASAPATADD